MAIDVEETYRRYGPMVVRRCRRLLGDDESAREAAQDVFVQLIRKQDVLTDTALSTLLLTMATHVSLNILRARRSRPGSPAEEILQEIADGKDGEGSALARLRLDGIFRGETPSTRVMAVLHYVDGLTLEQTAKHVGLSVSGVRKRLRALRARARVLEEV